MKRNKNESGRSMVEMLGVLAIIGVLSVGGVAGYRVATQRLYANKILEVADRFALMMENEFSDWNNSYYNDEEGCSGATSGTGTGKCTECMQEDTEYFCSLYGEEYCKTFQNNIYACYWGYAYALSGTSGFMITHGSDTVSFYVTSTFKNNALCEEVLTRILDLDVFKNHLSWFGAETMYQKATAKNIKDACAFGGKLNTVRIVLKK